MSAPPAYLTERAEGVELALYVAPRASRTAFVGAHGDMLKLQVAAPPVEGKANEAILKFLCEHFQRSKREVELLAGDTGRRKRVLLRGLSMAQAQALLAGV